VIRRRVERPWTGARGVAVRASVADVAPWWAFAEGSQVRTRSLLSWITLLIAASLALGACSTPNNGEVSPAGDPRTEGEEPGTEGGTGEDEAETFAAEVEESATGTDGPGEIRTPVRAVWVHLFDETLKSQEGIEILIEELVQAEATMVIAQVARRHDAYYRSEVLPATADPTLEEGLDVVDELVRQAHAHDIEVHAWVSMAPTWHEVYEDLPAPDGWLATDHGYHAPEEDRWVSRTAEGDWSEYLDPGVPAVRDHLARIAIELATTTDVDGIHLDYVRYESARHGYHPAAIERYQEEHEVRSTPAPDDPEFVAWRRQQTREIVEHVRAGLDAVPRPVALSAAVITWGPGPAGTGEGSFASTLPAGEALQDWPGWARDGLVDVLFPMNYFRDHVGEQAEWYEQWLDLESELATATDTLIVPGVAGWLNTPDATLFQVGVATAATDGAALYSYQQPTDDGSREIWRTLAEVAWETP
jgi:uncharacterized lipoprotein YddW (UPF0748 family)